MKNLKLLFLLISVVLFSNCADFITITEAFKTKNITGFKGAKNYTDYTLIVDVKKQINFENIALNNIKIEKTLYIKNLSNGLSSTKIPAEISKGKYQFGFRSFKTENEKEREVITFIFKVDGKKFTQKKEVIIKNVKTNK